MIKRSFCTGRSWSIRCQSLSLLQYFIIGKDLIRRVLLRKHLSSEKKILNHDQHSSPENQLIECKQNICSFAQPCYCKLMHLRKQSQDAVLVLLSTFSQFSDMLISNLKELSQLPRVKKYQNRYMQKTIIKILRFWRWENCLFDTTCIVMQKITICPTNKVNISQPGPVQRIAQCLAKSPRWSSCSTGVHCCTIILFSCSIVWVFIDPNFFPLVNHYRC